MRNGKNARFWRNVVYKGGSAGVFTGWIILAFMVTSILDLQRWQTAVDQTIYTESEQNAYAKSVDTRLDVIEKSAVRSETKLDNIDRDIGEIKQLILRRP